MKMTRTTKKTAKTNAAGTARLEKLRRQIDEVDARLVSLINQRSRLAKAIGHLKQSNGSPLYVPEREQQVLARLKKRNRGPVGQEALVAIYREIISAALALEGGLKIGLLDHGDGNVRAVARDHFGASAEYELAKSPSQAIRALERGRWNALCISESDMPAACAALQAGRVRVSAGPQRGCAILVGAET